MKVGKGDDENGKALIYQKCKLGTPLLKLIPVYIYGNMNDDCWVKKF